MRCFEKRPNFYARESFLLADGDRCPLYWTSYYHTSTGCEAHCKLAYKRDGSDNTCMPGKPECANWLEGDEFPQESLTVNAWCICGAKSSKTKPIQTSTLMRVQFWQLSVAAASRTNKTKRVKCKRWRASSTQTCIPTARPGPGPGPGPGPRTNGNGPIRLRQGWTTAPRQPF